MHRPHARKARVGIVARWPHLLGLRADLAAGRQRQTAGTRSRIEDVDNQPVTLWKMRRDHEEIACRARLVPYGIEIDMLNDGAVVLTRVFATDDEALDWARDKRGRRESEGWHVAPDEPNPNQPRVA